MEISIDESGSFVTKGALKNSWCVVSAYVSPETEKSKYKKALKVLKRKNLININHEIKINQINEETFIEFLKNLNELRGILLCVATDSNLNIEEFVIKHQTGQTSGIKDSIEEMIFEGGKSAQRLLYSQMDKLPPQLYIQLQCQNYLMASFIRSGINYFVQRTPYSMKRFRWRIDQKSPNKKTNFEDAFEKFCPAILQSMSLKEPYDLLDWCNYSPMESFMYKKGEIPDYLIQQFPHLKESQGLDVQKIIRDDIKFVDSKTHQGVQIADLLASGIRKLLRLKFNNNEIIANLFGKIMIQGMHNTSPIEFITFGEEKVMNQETAKIVKIVIKSSRPMVLKGSQQATL